jgi:hypothetical protein
LSTHCVVVVVVVLAVVLLVNGLISLHFASFNGKLDLVKFLISKGADVNAKIRVRVNNVPSVVL